jgi:hypothetical protein
MPFSPDFSAPDLIAAQMAVAEPADSGDLERLIRSIMNTGSGDHEHPLALA